MTEQMDLQRFSEFMSRNLRIIESESLYWEDGIRKTAGLELVAAWDDGCAYQIVIHVDAGPLQKFVGYASSADGRTREFAESSQQYLGLEDYLAQWIRREGMYGDGIVPKLEVSPDEIVWRYPQEAKHTPQNLKELYALRDEEDVWFNLDSEYLSNVE